MIPLNHHINPRIIVGFVLVSLMMITLGVGYLFGRNSIEPNMQDSDISQEIIPSIPVTPTPTSIYPERKLSDSQVEYLENLEPETKRFIESNILPQQKIKMNCTHLYLDDYYGPSDEYFYVDNKVQTLDNVKKLTLVRDFKKLLPAGLGGAAQFCLTDNSIYVLFGRGERVYSGIAESEMKIIDVSKDGPFVRSVWSYEPKIVGSFENRDRAAFFTCQMIALMQNQEMYFLCNGSSLAGPRNEYLYKVNFETSENKLIYSCSTRYLEDRETTECKDFTN